MMRTIFFLVLISLISCSEDKDNNNIDLQDSELTINAFPQQWKLFKMTGNMANSETTGEAMEWQETYYFYADHRFKKTRTVNSNVLEAEGSFEIVTNDEKALSLSFDQSSEIIGNCTGDKNEYLSFRENDSVLQSSWMACDGPGLFYKKE